MGSTGEAFGGTYSNRRIVLCELFTARSATILRTSKDTATKQKKNTYHSTLHVRLLTGNCRLTESLSIWLTVVALLGLSGHFLAASGGHNSLDCMVFGAFLGGGAWRLCMSSKHQAKCVGRSHLCFCDFGTQCQPSLPFLHCGIELIILTRSARSTQCSCHS